MEQREEGKNGEEWDGWWGKRIGDELRREKQERRSGRD